MVRNLGKIVLKELPGVYNKGVKKIKDKKLKKKNQILRLDIPQ